MSQDVDKTLKLAQTLKTGVSLGEKIAKDGVNLLDLPHAPEAVAFMVALHESVKDLKEIKEELTDLDAAEGIILLQTVLS